MLVLLTHFFCKIKAFIRFPLAFVFGLQAYYLIDFSKIYQLKGLDSKTNAKQNHMNDFI